MTPRQATVLVVDDEEGLRRVVTRTLAGVGFAVLEAEHGAAALRVLAAAEAGVHLVISDIHMPVMDGLAFARELRGARPGVPILFMTGRESPDLVGEVLRKPFGSEQLLEMVSRMLGQPADARSAAG